MSSAVSAGDLTLYRTHPQVANSYLWVDKPPAVYRGQVNQVAAFTYPITAAVPFDNGSGTIGDVQIDMLVTFGTTVDGDDLGRTRVLGITGTTLGIPRISQGTVDGTVKLSNDIYFTIWDTYPPAPKIPFWDESTQTFFKDGDDVFVAALPPVANIGYAHIYADLVNSSDKLVLTIDSTDSFSPIGGTLTRLWDVEDGTITSGSTSSTAITVEFPVGRRWIKLTLTDTTNSRATIRHLLIVACKLGDATYAPIVDARAGTLTQTVEGVRQSFTFGQDIAATTYLDGVAVCYFQREFYGTTEDSLHDAVVVKFAGWHRTDPARIQAQQTHLLTEVTLDCLDTAGVLATLPGFPQTIEAESSPLRWEQMASPNLDKFLAYLWLYHSTASNLVDFTWSATTTTYPFVRLNALGNNLYAQIDGRARAIGYRLLSNVKGRCKVKKDSMLFDSGSRDSVNVISFTESDIVSISYTHQRPPRSHWNRGNAIVASSTAVNAVFCIAPGVVPSWGTTAGEIGENLVANQTELNARVGHAYQRENAPEGYVEVELLHGGDIGLEPLDFIRITLSSDYAAQRGLTWTTQRFAIVVIYTDYDPVYGTKRVRLTLEKEVFGTPAETVIPPENPLPEFPIVTDLYPHAETVTCDGALTLDQCTGTIGLIRQDGNFSRTTNFHTPSASGGPTWTTVSMGTSGTVQSYAVDPFSPRYISGTGAVNLWVATSTGIYKVSDVFGSISAALQYSFVATNRDVDIDASITQSGWLVCSIDYGSTGGHSGIWTTYTTDGTNWSAEAQITAHYGGIAGAMCVCSQVTAGTAYTGAYTSTSPALASVYKTTNHGAAWTEVTSPTGFDFNDFIHGGFHLPYQNENIKYLGGGIGATLHLVRDNGDGTMSTITPSVSGTSYVPFPSRSISSSPQNRLKMVVVCANGDFKTFTTQDGGDTWTELSTGGAAYGFVAIAGDNSNIVYFTGETGEVGYSSDFSTVDDRAGDLGYSGYIPGLVGG